MDPAALLADRMPRISLPSLLLLLLLGLQACQCQDGQDPCANHQVLSDDWRNAGATAGMDSHCDIMAEGWYSFVLGKDPARVPTLCMQDSTCGAKVPLHVDMGDEVEPGVGENVTAWLCGSYNVLGSVDCCVQRQPVVIKHCPDPAGTFIYYLKPQTVCPVAVCAVRVTETIPSEFVAKPGDVPRSLRSQNAIQPVDDSASPAPGAAETTPQEIVRRLVTESFNDTHSDVPPSSDNSSVSDAYVSSPGNSSSSDHSTDRTLSTSNSSSSTISNATDSLMPEENTTAAVVFPGGDDRPYTDNVTYADLSSGPESESETTTSTNITTTSTDDDHSGSESENTTSVAAGNNNTDTAFPSASSDVQQSSDRKTTLVASTADPSSLKNVSSIQTGFVFVSPPASPSLDNNNNMSAAGSTPVSASESDGQSSEGMVSDRVPPLSVTVATETPFEAVRFVLNGTYEETLFRNALLMYVNNESRLLNHGFRGEDLHHMILTAETSPDNMTVVDVFFIDPATNGTVPPQRLVNIINNDTFADHLFAQTHMSLMAVCPSIDRCDDQNVGTGKSETGQHGTLFHRNQAVFVAVIVVAALSLLALLLGLLFVRCRRQGTWVLAPDHEEKGPEPMSVESPMSDRQILQGETETTLTVNGDGHPLHTPKDDHVDTIDNRHDDIPAADEDNGWVVPLDQAPPSTPVADGLAQKTEDTQF